MNVWVVTLAGSYGEDTCIGAIFAVESAAVQWLETEGFRHEGGIEWRRLTYITTAKAPGPSRTFYERALLEVYAVRELNL